MMKKAFRQQSIEYFTTKHRHYVYVFHNAAGADLYVGCTCDLNGRVKTHLKNWWGNQIARVSYTEFKDRTEARVFEAYLIGKLDPEHNNIVPNVKVPLSLVAK